MTLTLEQVRQTRFHLARRNGYEPVDVDNFVDKVEATLSQLSEENQTLKQQVEALGSSEPSSIFVPGDPGATDPVCPKSPDHALIDTTLAEAEKSGKEHPLVFRDPKNSARLGRAF